MPLYVYRCEKCGHEFDEIHKIADPSPPCPKVSAEQVEQAPCGGDTQKLITGGSFHLKGSGWASDGYA